MRFLLRHSGVAAILRCAVTAARLSNSEWEGVPWPRREGWLYSFATRLLWRHAERNDATDVTALPEPAFGNPFPVRYGGRPVSQDFANSGIEVTAILRALDGRSPGSILEVGAGYGRTAYVLLKLFPRATYTIIDINGWVPVGSVDLALSISSLQEMTAEQVHEYAGALDRVAENGIVFLKQWISWRNPSDDIELRFEDYPIRRDGRRCLLRQPRSRRTSLRQHGV